MTDSDVKTPNKRKSLPPQVSGKKQKLNNGTPQKQKTPNKNAKQQQSPKVANVQNSAKKVNKNKKTSESENEAQKKLKPFAGTGDAEKKKEVKKQAKNEDGESKKKKRRGQFSNLLAEIKAGDEDKKKQVAKNIDNKIKAIESRAEITKTAKRKLMFLKKLKNLAEGKVVEKTEKPSPKPKGKQENKKVKNEPKPAAKNAKKGKKVEKVVEEEEEEEEDDDEDSSEQGIEDQGEESDEEGEEESGEEEEDDDDGLDEEESEDEEEEEPPKEKVYIKKNKDEIARKSTKEEGKTTKGGNAVVAIEGLKKNEILKKGQTRYVLFLGNIPYDVKKSEIINHFSKAGDILHIRIPLEKKTNKPRGFAYLEVKDEDTYQKCMSMHHSVLNGRRINVMYTQGGKKKPEERKKEIKAKNMKLHALRRQGKLAGSTKENHKRSFRRAKKNTNNKSEQD